MTKVLFVCRANTIRSQMAEAMFNKLAKPKDTSHSAGIKTEYLEGMQLARANPRTIQSLRELGFDASKAKVKAISKDNADAADKIVCMAKEIILPSYVDKNKVEFWDVPIPFDDTTHEYALLRDIILIKVKKLIESID